MSLIKLNSNFGAIYESIKKFIFNDLFTDVTLVSDDMQKYSAHRIILSICSPVLQELLLSCPQFINSHMILHVRGFNGEQLQMLLEFIYAGELQIEDSKVPDFLRLAKELKLNILDSPLKEDEKHPVSTNIETLNVNKIRKDFEILNSSNITVSVTEKTNECIPKPEKSEIEKLYNEAYSKSTTVTFENEECNVVTENIESVDIAPSLHNVDKNLGQELDNKTYTHLGTELQKNNECHICDSIFLTKRLLKTHHQNYHNYGNLKHFECKKCQKVFTEIRLLKNHFETVHMKDHHRYQCAKCEFKSFSTREQQSHYRHAHVDAKVPCDTCNAVFKSDSRLRQHKEMVHLGLKREKCDQCGKEYLAQHLKEHKRRVHDGKKYPCNFCPFEASCPKYIVKHEAMHNGVEYPCNQCDYKGKQKETLKRHIRVEHENLRFYCDQCPLKTRSQYQLKKHKARKHK